jgi:hypothetical protein
VFVQSFRQDPIEIHTPASTRLIQDLNYKLRICQLEIITITESIQRSFMDLKHANEKLYNTKNLALNYDVTTSIHIMQKETKNFKMMT